MRRPFETGGANTINTGLGSYSHRMFGSEPVHVEEQKLESTRLMPVGLEEQDEIILETAINQNAAVVQETDEFQSDRDDSAIRTSNTINGDIGSPRAHRRAARDQAANMVDGEEIKEDQAPGPFSSILM